MSAILGLSRDADHVYRWDDGKTESGPLPSVTSVLKIVDKSGPLIGWAKRVTAEAAVDNADQIQGWVALGGRSGAVSFLTKAADAKRDRAADVGTRIHALAEATSRGHAVSVTDEERPFLVAYANWRREFEPKFIAAEEMVASLRYRYAGTLDAIVEMLGEVWLVDYKTSKGTYPETALQLAAYANADFIGRPGVAKRFRIPKVTQFGVLHLRPEGYELLPYAVTEDTFRAFLHARQLHEWRETQARSVMGSPLGPQLFT